MGDMFTKATILEPTSLPVKPIQHLHTQHFTSNLESDKVKTIQEHVDMYYPQVQAQHAPRTEVLRCFTEGCSVPATSFYTCLDCFFQDWFCKECMVAKHKNNPLHAIKRWKDGCQEDASLFELGLTIKLPHADGTSCSTTMGRHQLKIFHINGIHRVSIRVCRCKMSPGENAMFRGQLTASRLFPATHRHPTTAFTFDLLEKFDSLNLEGALNFKQFLDAIISISPTKVQNGKEVGLHVI
jgi:hypothetical protein